MDGRINCCKPCNYNFYIFVILLVNYVKIMIVFPDALSWLKTRHLRTLQNLIAQQWKQISGILWKAWWEWVWLQHFMPFSCRVRLKFSRYSVFSCIPTYFHLLLVIMKSHSDQPPISLVFFCYCLSSILNSDYWFNLTIQIKCSCSIILVYCSTTSNFVFHNELA